MEIPDSEYAWIEQHAYEFAGRLLVPREKLIEKLMVEVEILRSHLNQIRRKDEKKEIE